MARNSNPHFRIGTIGLAAVMLLITPAQCRSTYQFQSFFPAWSGKLTDIRDNLCTQQWDAYNDAYNETHNIPYDLANCILENLHQFDQTELGVVTVVFGLLPSVMMFIGPTTDEISLLALRRPLLAFMLSVAMPAVRFSDDSPFSKPWAYLREPVDISARPGRLSRPTFWAKALVSTVEYVVAAAAVANMCYQSYLLAFRCITVSTIAIYFARGLPENYAPFLWIMLTLALQEIGRIASSLRYATDPNRPRPQPGKQGPLVRGLVDEATPCCYRDPVFLEPRQKTYLYVGVALVRQGGVVILYLYATIILSSQIFISLGDAIPVIAFYMMGAYACRLILSFELHGMKEVTSLALQAEAAPQDHR